MASISTSASLGRRLTSTAERAGQAAAPMQSAYTAFIAEKSFMSFKNTVVLTT